MICQDPFYKLPKAGTERVPVPCGRCPACLTRRVDNWVFRLLQQAKIEEFSHFVTLTYDTRFVPISENRFLTLRKKDFQDYMKRLRNLCPDATIKYYAAGEYGAKRKRPHFHAIVFGVSDPELFFRAWSLDGVPLGEVFVGAVSGDSIAYTAKYIQKSKWTKEHARDDREPEFSLMSKGLGLNYVSGDIVKYHQADLSRLYVTLPGGFRKSLPRYYREKIYTKSQQAMQTVLIANAVTADYEKKREDFERTTGKDFLSHESEAKYAFNKRFWNRVQNNSRNG